jgi:hypothetical protein
MFDSTVVENILNNKRKHRNDCIKKLGGGFQATLQYDFHEAPLTTNRQQLSEIGVNIPPYDEFISELDMTNTNWDVIHGLFTLGIEVVNTNHLSDLGLYQTLQKILDEPIRDVVLGADVSEILDLNTNNSTEKVSNRDATLPRFTRI